MVGCLSGLSQSPTRVLPHPFSDSGGGNSPEIGIFASRPLAPKSFALSCAALHFQHSPILSVGS